MPDKTILISEQDRQRIEQLMLFCDLFKEQEKRNIRKLHYDASRGRVVSPEDMPADVATPRSHIVLRDVATGREFDLTLVFPEEAEAHPNPVSILTPMGAALMGRKTGETIEDRTAAGIRRLTIAAIAPPQRP
ncbi:GreA/GreB family elongation factor [Desulfobulbus elongatus]|uniref:GreA/GreB family elongation factor n=1 Tax=Desulfobulbus elongatus TaxID=53332 RepID=UPI000488D9D4|nr:GreA/GreB family elongation factor [Desulfobulbus elongatus]